MKILIVGLIKGLVIGSVSGVIFDIFDTGHHLLPTKLFLFAFVGLLVGLLCGEPVWKENGRTAAMIKGGVGIIIGLIFMTAIYYLLDFEVGTKRLSSHYETVGGLFGAMYGAFVEFDDKH